MNEQREQSGLPPSPCRRICRQNAEAGFCEGCGRTVLEVFRWTSLAAAERSSILSQLPGRLASLNKA